MNHAIFMLATSALTVTAIIIAAVICLSVLMLCAMAEATGRLAQATILPASGREPDARKHSPSAPVVDSEYRVID